MTFSDLFWTITLLWGLAVVIWPNAKNYRIWSVLIVTRILVWALTGV